MDRIDNPIEVPRVDYEKLSNDRGSESSASIRTCASCARETTPALLEEWLARHCLQCRYGRRGDQAILLVARRWSAVDPSRDIVLCMMQLNLSARVYHRIPRLARTIADLVGVRKSNLSILLRRCTRPGRPKLMDGLVCLS